MFRQAGLQQQTPVLPFGANNFTNALSGGDTVETYKFYKGGTVSGGVNTGGTQVAQWVITYTDNTRATVVSGVYTDLSAP